MGYPCKRPPLSAAAVSAQRVVLAVGSPGEPDSCHPPGRPGLPPQRPRAETKARGRAAAPQQPLRASGQAGRTRTGVPKVTRTRYPSSRSAKPSQAARAELGSRRHRRLQPAARRGLQGGGVALRKSPSGSPGERRTPAPASRAGLPGVPGRVLCTVLPIAASGRGVGGGALRVHGG